MAINFRFFILCAGTFPNRRSRSISSSRSRFKWKKPDLFRGTDNVISLRNGCRTLLSDTTTNIENYTRQRIFKVDLLQECGKVNLFRTLQALSKPEEVRRILPLVIDSLHCAETEEDCNTVESVLRLLSPNDESERQEFFFGAILFRMYHFLGMPEKALGVFQDRELKKFVQDNTCHILLMDLLYKHKKYLNVMEVLSGMPRYESNCYTIAFGALYHINTPESFEEAQSLIRTVQQSGHNLQTRAAIFYMMLALKQVKAKEALDCLSLCKHNNITRNLELICRCRLGHFETIFRALDGSLIAAKDSTKIMNKRLYHETWSEIQSAMRTSDTSNMERLRKLEKRLCESGLLSMQKISVLMERTIPGDKDYKRERGKRVVDRSNVQ